MCKQWQFNVQTQMSAECAHIETMQNTVTDVQDKEANTL